MGSAMKKLQRCKKEMNVWLVRGGSCGTEGGK